MNEFSSWLENSLNDILGFQSSEIVNYILGLDNDGDRYSYLTEMLDPQGCPEHKNFLDQFQAKCRERNGLLQNMTVYKKAKDELPQFKATGARPKQAATPVSKGSSRK